MINNKKRMYSAVLMTLFLVSSGTTVPFAGYSKVAVGAGAVTAAGVVATLGAVAYKKSAKVRRFCKSRYGKAVIGLFVAVVAAGVAVYNKDALLQLCLKPADATQTAALLKANSGETLSPVPPVLTNVASAERGQSASNDPKATGGVNSLGGRQEQATIELFALLGVGTGLYYGGQKGAAKGSVLGLMTGIGVAKAIKYTDALAIANANRTKV